MATTMVGQCCKLLNLISGIKNLKLSLTLQPRITGLSRPLWTGAIFDAGNKETVRVSKNVLVKPKMPANVFVTFLQKVTAGIMENQPGIKRTDIVREASKMWQDLDPEEKSRLTLERKDLFEKYKEDTRTYLDNMTPEQIQAEELTKGKRAARKLKSRLTLERRELFDKYKEDMRTYLDNMTPEQIQAEELRKGKRAARKLKSLRKELGMPKKPLGPFNYYLSEKFPENPGQPISSYFKLLTNEWAELSDAEKEKYLQRSREDTKQYKEDIVKWEKEMVALGRFDVVRKSYLAQLNKTKRTKPAKKKTVGFSAHDSDSDL